VSVRGALVTVVAALPASELKNALLRRLGWAIGDGVRIAPCFVFRVDHVDVGSGAFINSFNVIKDLAAFTLGEQSEIGSWNYLTASRRLGEAGAPCVLHLGPHSVLTSRHYMSCSGGVRVGTHTAIAGVRSTFMTHGTSPMNWPARTLRRSHDPTLGPIEIGDYCLISSNVQVSPGTVVGSRIVVGMGATIDGQLLDPGLYMQSRATLVKTDLRQLRCHREEGHVGTVQER
jgi:acetyltransferase-like isoleucine patch superfamily enzyme